MFNIRKLYYWFLGRRPSLVYDETFKEKARVLFREASEKLRIINAQYSSHDLNQDDKVRIPTADWDLMTAIAVGELKKSGRSYWSNPHTTGV